MKLRCFACDRVIHLAKPLTADTRDDQVVFVGRECFKHIQECGEDGWQPPKGGPRLYPARAFPDHNGQQVACSLVFDADEREWNCRINPHGDGFVPMGRGRTIESAMQDAAKRWKQYDEQP